MKWVYKVALLTFLWRKNNIVDEVEIADVLRPLRLNK